MTITLVAVLSAVVGLFSGYFLRELVDLIRRRYSARESRMRPHRPHVTAQMIQIIALGLAVLLLLVEGLLLILTRHETAQYTRCTAQWQQQFSDSYKARVDSASEVSTAMDRVIKAVYSSDPDAFKAAIQNYVNVRARQDAAREKNPLPAPPDEVCGKPGGAE